LIFCAPFIFALSHLLIASLGQQFSKLNFSASSNLPIHISEIGISGDFITQFSVIALIVSGIMASLVIGVINSNHAKHGIKYVPFLTVLPIISYYSIRTVVTSVMSGVF